MSILAAIGNFVSDVSKRALGTFFGNTATKSVENKKSSEKTAPSTALVVQQDSRMVQAEVEYYRGKSERERELVKIQAGLLELRQHEIVANWKIAAAQAEREERGLWISEQNLQVRRQELELARERLAQEKHLAEMQRRLLEQALQLRERELQLMAEELSERRKLSYLYLDFLREKQASEITLRLNEIQAHFDLKTWSGVLSREEMQKILLEGQQKHRLLLLVSPPEISRDCPDTFINNLQLDVQSDLKAFVEQHYPFNSDECPVEFFGKFFQHSIFDTQVKQLEALLSPIPTAILYSTVTDEKLSLHIRFWGLSQPLSLTMPWGWEQEYEKWVAEGKTEKESLRLVRQAIVKIHQVVAAFLVDLYYLQVNPHHLPRVWDLTEEFSAEWLHKQLSGLYKLQEDILAKYQQEVQSLSMESAKIAEERKRREAEEARARALAEEERRRRKEEDQMLGNYCELRDLLAAGKWYDADEKTKMLMLKEVERTTSGCLDQASIEKFSAKDLQIIDGLWVKYSNGRFGFSVQKRVYEECRQNWVSFLSHLHWFELSSDQIKNSWGNRTIKYSLNAPEGHLPAAIFLSFGQPITILWAKLEEKSDEHSKKKRH